MNRNYLFLIILLLGISRLSPSIAQVLSPHWAFQVGGQEDDRGMKLMADLTGNIYFAGTIENTACINQTTDTITSLGYEDIVFGKINQDGQLLWRKHLGGKGTDAPSDITVNANGEVFLSGIFEDTIHFGTTFLKAKDYIDSFIAKYDSLGILLWLRQISGLDSEHCVTITCDTYGNLICGGFFANTLEFPLQNTGIIQSQGEYDGFLAKWSPWGALLWIELIPGPEISQVKDVLMDNNNSCYVIGTFSGTVIPDSTQNAISSLGGKDVFIARYNPLGDLLWFKTAGSILDDNAKCLTLGGNDKMIMTGEFKENLRHENKTILSADGGDDIFHLKFNKNGILQSFTKHGDINNDFVFDAWIPVGQKIMMASDLKILGGNKSVTLANYEMLGNIADILETSTNFNPIILSAVMTQPDEIYFCGTFHDKIVLDQFTLNSRGQEDLFIVKLAPEQDSVSELKRNEADTIVFPASDMYPTVNDDFTLYSYPNPFGESTQIIYSLPQAGNVYIEILDMKGNIIRKYDFPNQSAGNHVLDFNGKELHTGNYYCRFYASGETISVIKVIKLMCLH